MIKINLGNVEIFDSNNREIKPIKQTELIGMKFNEYSLVLNQIYIIITNKTKSSYKLEFLSYQRHLKEIKEVNDSGKFGKFDFESYKKRFAKYDKKHLMSLEPMNSLWLMKRFSKRTLYFDFNDSNGILLLLKSGSNLSILFKESNKYRGDFYSHTNKFETYLIHKGNLTKAEQLEHFIYGNNQIEPE